MHSGGDASPVYLDGLADHPDGGIVWGRVGTICLNNNNNNNNNNMF